MSKSKILFLVNIILPEYSKYFGLPSNYFGGWISSAIDLLRQEHKYDIVVCFPDNSIKEQREMIANDIKYIGFTKRKYEAHKYDRNLKNVFKQIILREKPDLVHIFGTEYSHSLIFCEAFKTPEKTIINMQGICSAIYLHYLDALPSHLKYCFTLKELIKQDNLLLQKRRFKMQAENERKTLALVDHVIGRTSYDISWVKYLNDNVVYHHCGETLRPPFYSGRWKYDECVKHSIFITQAGYSIKGLHIFLKALKEIVKEFPNCKVKIAGPNILSEKKLFKRSSYFMYLENYIKNNHLYGNIEFLGYLSDIEIKNELLKTNVLVIPSMCENSPNSLGEAMMLSVPCVCSDVGGISEMIRHNEEGFVYQANDFVMLAHYIKKTFLLKEEVEKHTEKAYLHAKETYNCEKNNHKLLEIYDSILKPTNQSE